jgi:hypothetical protein
MHITFSTVGLLLAFLGLGACDGSGSGLRTLSPGDVTGLPSGNAAGSAFSGTYTIKDSVVVDCHCRQGPCSQIHASTGHALVVTQKDGALQIVENNADTCLGGIDQDGKLWCGYSTRADSYTLLLRWEGTAVRATSLDVTSDMTVAGTVDGQYYDCDAEVHFHAPYVGP